MFRPTESQLSLMESRFLVSPDKRARLERSWAESFRVHVLPLIDEEVFRDCFCDNNGRPNKSIRLMVGVHLLKEADDLTDEQILDALEFNIQWQHALGVEPADAHVCEKTLHNFRHLLSGNTRAEAVFEQMTEAMMEADGLSSVRQRLDSTHVISNIRLLTRLGLFTETVTVFLRELRKEAPEKLAKLDGGYAKRYLDREGYFADAKREQAQRRLPVVAQDLYALVRAFEGDETVKGWTYYGLLVRLLSEQCEVTIGEVREGSVKLKEPAEIGGTSLQSPHDPDVTYGHKGKGYEAQLAETCVEGNPYQVITGVDVTGAHASDQDATVPMVVQLVERDLAPKAMLTDTGYSSGENIVACAEMGVALVAPVQDPTALPRPDRWEESVEAATSATDTPAPKASITQEPTATEAIAATDPPSAEAPTAAKGQCAPRLGLEAFTFTHTFDKIVACPAGYAPLTNELTDAWPPFKATFDGQRCATCPLVSRCPSRRSSDGDRTLRWRDVKAATATRQREQQEPEFKEQYKLRSGIESTNAEFKGRHGASKLRVRQRWRVEVAIHLKALALNVKRAVQHHTEVHRADLNRALTVCLAPT